MSLSPVHGCASAGAGRSLVRVRALAVCPLLAFVLSACGDNPQAISISETVLCPADPSSSLVFPPLPARAPPAAVTTGRVPHRQVNPLVSPAAIVELHERVFQLPEVEARASLLVPGSTSIWIRPEIVVERPECIVAGREVAHIHGDGSMHATLPLGRIPDAEAAGWIERHPWAGQQPGFEAFVLIFVPRSSAEVTVLVELIREGLDFVRGN